MELLGQVGEAVAIYAEEHEGEVYMHLEVNQWTHNIYKAVLILFEDIKQVFREKGYTRLRSVSPKGKESKLTVMFGLAHILETSDHYINEVRI